MKSTFTKIFLAFTTIFLLNGCQSIDVQGQYIDDKLISQLQNNKMTKNEVVDLIGTPSIVSSYDEDTWYYPQRSISKRAWSSPKVVEQRVVELTFNDDIIKQVILLENTHLDNFKPLSIITISESEEEKSFTNKFFGNIGRFNKKKIAKKKR